jgi:uncharacterized protein (TIGR02996 family)
VNTLTATERQLLSAVRADPDDDTVRLAYADWLDELGGVYNEAAAFYIRESIDWVRRGWGDVTFGGQLTRATLPDGVSGEFDRGFCVSVRCSLSVFEAVAADLFLRQPLIRRVELTDRYPYWLPGARVYGWHTNVRQWNSSLHNDELPPDLLLLCHSNDCASDDEVRYYQTQAAAADALSDACVRFGLQAAGWEVADGR